MDEEELRLWREIAILLQQLKDHHAKRTGHAVWRQVRRWDIGLRCFGGCDSPESAL